MVALARDDAFGRLNQIDARLFATTIESIWCLARLSSCLFHHLQYLVESESCVNHDCGFSTESIFSNEGNVGGQ